MDIPQRELVTILRLALGAFREEFGRDITATRILTLLSVLENPGMAQGELPTVLKEGTPGAVSKNVKNWLSLPSPGEKGPDMIRQVNDPAFRNRNLLYPTERAIQWTGELAKEISGKLPRSSK